MKPSYYEKSAAAFVRGMAVKGELELPAELGEPSFDDLSTGELNAVVCLGAKSGLRLHRFKRTSVLPRAQRVFGVLKGLQPSSLLDVGSGRGVFLWPLLDSFQGLPVTAIDLRQDRAEQLACARLGGMEQLVAHRMDVTELNFDDSSFDVTTALEVVEHIPDAQEAINEITRVSRQAVIVSVPSKEDDNPDHIHLFTQDTMREMFHQAGVTKIKFDYVLNHMIAVANVQQT